MLRWIPYTFVRTVLFFVGGILLAYYFPEVPGATICFVLIALLSVLYFVVVFSGRGTRKLINPGWIALPLMFFIGYGYLVSRTESQRSDHLLHVGRNISYYEAVITQYAEEKARSWKLEAQIMRVNAGHWEQRSGRIILYFSKTDFPQPFVYGDVLLVKGQPSLPDGPANPGEFNYRRHLALKNIYHQQFVRQDEAIKIRHDPPSAFTDFAFRGRAWAEATLSRFVRGERQQAIASALVLGVTDGLDNELLNAYSATGSMHILAVSGLHISIIYLILLRMFSLLHRVPRGKWIIAFLSLGILWLYAFVTGLNPSVLRAVMMFSFLAIAKPWARSTNVYNTLAVSAFCLLIYDPFLIFSVGFQLSYLAVLGIVYLYPRILRWWEPEHRLTLEVWKIIAVSLAAQLATFSLGLLYFHQFPNYFLLSNLLVVPLSFVVLIGGLLVLAASLVSPIAAALGFCLEMVIRLLNGIVFVLEDLPFSVIGDVFISGWQCVFLMMGIIALLALFEFRKFGYLVFGSVMFCGVAVLQWVHFYRDVQVNRMTVYKIPGHSAMDLMTEAKTAFFADSALSADATSMRYHIIPNRLMAGVKGEAEVRRFVFRGGALIVWKGRKILQLHSRDANLPSALEVDWVVIGNNAIDLSRMLESVQCRKVILDSSNSFFFAARFLEAAKLHKLDVHSVLHQGAFNTIIQKGDT